MLKLERKSRDGQVNVLVRDKEYTFNRTLWMAFSLAIAFHLSFFLIFHITPFRISIINTLFPPVNVESYPIPNEIRAVASNEPVFLTLNGIPFPAPSKPQLPFQPEYSDMSSLEYTKEATLNSAFADRDRGIRLADIPMPQRKPKHPIEVVVSGFLSEKKIVNGIPEKYASPSHDARVVYAVKVLGTTGKVFWFEAKEVTNNASINSFAENIIRNLAFAEDPVTFEMSGEIELHFHQETL